MRKWEERYEKLKNGEFDDRIDELKTKVDERKANREELKEYEKLSKSKGNLSKVENIIKFKKNTQLYLNDINKELKLRENLIKASQESVKIQAELMQIEKELENINNNLKDKTIEPEEKAKIQDRRKELLGKRDDNNKKYMENQAVLKDALNSNEKFKGYSDKELKELKLKTSAKISKCNMIANSLVNGLSWDSIDLKLDNWQKLTKKKDKIVDKVNENKSNGNNVEDLDIFSSEEKKRENEKLKKKQEKQAEFAKKHPRLAKFRNWFKKVFKREEALPEPLPTNTQTKEKLDTDKSFKEYIKYVAEYGEKDARKKQLKEKYERPDRETAMTEKGKKSLGDIDKLAKELQAKNEKRLKEETEGR